MKRQVKRLTALLLAAFMILSCAMPTMAASKGPSKTILKAYAKTLQKYGSSYNFALIYFDNDAIPELLLTPRFSAHIARAQLFTYKKGKVVEYKYAGSDYGRFFYVPKKGIAINDAWANGYGSITTYKKYSAPARYKVFGKLESGQRSGKAFYYVNGKRVKKSAYTAYTKAYKKKFPARGLNPSNLFPNNRTNINKMLKNYKSVAKLGFHVK